MFIFAGKAWSQPSGAPYETPLSRLQPFLQISDQKGRNRQ